MPQEVPLLSNWAQVFSYARTVISEWLESSTSIRCINKYSESGHDFNQSSSFLRRDQLDSSQVTIVSITRCRYCGKIEEKEMKGVALIGGGFTTGGKEEVM